MSSKKARRRKRQEQRQRPRKRNPATLFILGIALALLLLAVGALVFGNRSGAGDPPWPGAVWSAEHGHWH